MTPDVLAWSFLHEPNSRVLGQWRDGALQLVVCRDLVKIYLQVLSRLGVGNALLRRWMVWFSSSQAACWIEEAPPARETAALCDWLLQAGKADRVVHSGRQGSPAPARTAGTKWISALELQEDGPGPLAHEEKSARSSRA